MSKLRYLSIIFVLLVLLVFGIGKAVASSEVSGLFALTLTPTVVTETPVTPPVVTPGTETPVPTASPTVPVPPGDSPSPTPRAPRNGPTRTPRPQILPETGEKPAAPPPGGIDGLGLLAVGLLIGLALGLTLRSLLASSRVRIFSLVLIITALAATQWSQIGSLAAGYTRHQAEPAGQVMSFQSLPSTGGEKQAVFPSAPGDAVDQSFEVMRSAASAGMKPAFAPLPRDMSPDDSAIQSISIPALEVKSSVQFKPLVDGAWDITGLRENVAWLGSTSSPGEGGNTVLAAHVNVLNVGPGPFHSLDRLQAGDQIFVYTEKNVYVYQVREHLVVKEDDVSVTESTGSPQLTLVTCSNWDADSETYLRRQVVRADLAEVRKASQSGLKDLSAP